jgi:hypothetical protein
MSQAHNGACMSGGAVRGDVLPASQWGSVYPTGNTSYVPLYIGTGSLTAGGPTMTNILVEGFRFARSWDAFRVGSNNPKVNNLTIKGCWISDIHDDAVEDDDFASMVIDDCLFDGFFSGVSFDNQYSQWPGTTIVVQNTLMRLKPMGSSGATEGPGLNPGHKYFIKSGRDGAQIPLTMTNCTFAVQQMSNAPAVPGQDPGHPFYRLYNDYNMSLLTSSGNKLLWVTTNAMPHWTFPSGFTVQTGTAAINTWRSARTAWLNAHPLVPRLGSPYDDDR